MTNSVTDEGTRDEKKEFRLWFESTLRVLDTRAIVTPWYECVAAPGPHCHWMHPSHRLGGEKERGKER